jgi:DNA-binding transcriptional LysR family regulator
MEQVKEANALMSGLTATPSGRLVVAVPMAFSREILAPHLPEFCERHPQIELELIVTGQPVDIIRDQIDVAVVVGALNDSELITKTLYQGELLWVTSPQYAERNRLDGSLEELLSHLKICEKRYAQGRLPVRENGQRRRIDLRKNIIQVNDPITVREAVIGGIGLSFLPSQYCAAQIESGELLKVYEHIRFDVSASALSVVYPGRRLIPNKTRAFLDFLFGICNQF